MSLTLNDIKKDADTYLPQNLEIIPGSINRMDIALDKHTRPISKSVKGLWPQASALITNVVQGFTSTWNAMGDVQITHKLLKNYRHKVNFEVKPDDIETSYFSHLYQENLKPEDMPITKFIIEVLMLPKVIDDMATLSVNGVYDAANLGVFGNAMNGVDNTLNTMLANVPGTDPTPFKIPLNAITNANRIEQVKSFELQIPSKLKSKVKKIFCSEAFLDNYKNDYMEAYGNNSFLNDVAKTPIRKLEMVGIPGWTGDTLFATIDGNFVRLIDFFDGKPAITDVQKQDYVVKFFMEFWKGYDFLLNEAVFISNYVDAEYGLGSTALNQKYYGFDGVSIA